MFHKYKNTPKKERLDTLYIFASINLAFLYITKNKYYTYHGSDNDYDDDD